MPVTRACPGWQAGAVTVTTPVPTLTDGVVTLRAHSLDDAVAIVDHSRDPESLRWTTVPRPYTREHAVGFIEGNLAAWGEAGAKRSWAIEWTDDGGDARFRGLMSRAVRLVVRHAFATPVWGVPVRRVHWRAIVGNWGSRRAAWAAGFTFHGTLPGSHPDPDG